MAVEAPSLFTQVIQEHLELKHRNSELDREMPIDNYRVEDPFDNHPLFKSEEQARLEETMDGTGPAVVAHGESLRWPGEESIGQAPRDGEDALWGRSRDFDWGE